MLNTGGAVLMPWLDEVKGVLEMWYPGDQFGRAAAGLLFGDAEPGRPAPDDVAGERAPGPGPDAADVPGRARPEHDERRPRGSEKFSEGVTIGYRYWDAYAQEPLFPFGYGLSYTKVRLRPRCRSPGTMTERGPLG